MFTIALVVAIVVCGRRVSHRRINRRNSVYLVCYCMGCHGVSTQGRLRMASSTNEVVVDASARVISASVATLAAKLPSELHLLSHFLQLHLTCCVATLRRRSSWHGTPCLCETESQNAIIQKCIPTEGGPSRKRKNVYRIQQSFVLFTVWNPNKSGKRLLILVRLYISK